MANQRGMKLPQPVFENLEVNAMEQRFAEFSKAKIQFVLYIDERFVKSHGNLSNSIYQISSLLKQNSNFVNAVILYLLNMLILRWSAGLGQLLSAMFLRK